jgi:D-sedoheptulose 7-phosphate isomerase
VSGAPAGSPATAASAASAAAAATAEQLVARRLDERRTAGDAFFADAAPVLAALCHRMAERFARSGRLLAIGTTPAARSDVHHVTVEFVHPVIVGKRALPALGLTGDSAPLPAELALAVGPDDIVMAFGDGVRDPELTAAITHARRAGALTVAFAPLGAEVALVPPTADSFIAQELVETAYHVLWELVHVFFDHRGLLAGRDERPVHDAGAASFLYPFLSQSESDLDTVLADVAGSVAMKWADVVALRAATLSGGLTALRAAAAALRGGADGGGRLLALGNGGSATDACDLVADFMDPPERRGWPGRAALDLSADAAIITALANDIGSEAIFARQIIAHGRPGDTVLALSTSGNSLSVLDALAEARRRSLTTVALVGYDGGRIAAEALADHVIVSPSQYIPRIQEAQATASHLLRELVELTER